MSQGAGVEGEMQRVEADHNQSAVSYAAVFDLQEETGLVGVEYSMLTSVVYMAQLVCQPLSSYALIVFPVKYWVM